MWPLDSIPAEQQTTTVISAGTSQRIPLSGANFVRIAVGAKGIWLKFGDSTVTATAGTAAEVYLPAPWVDEIAAPKGTTHLAIIQEGATAVGSVTIFN